MTDDGGPSPEALDFLAEETPVEASLDAEEMAARRAEVNAAWVDTAGSAIERHDLELADETHGGVPCLRVRSRRTAGRPGTLVWFFGGGFVWGEPRSELQIVGPIAESTGIDIVLPDYRLAPEHPAPAAAEDAWAAWVAVSELGSDPLWLGGESAGGNLALLVAQRCIAEGRPAPKALALLSPAADLRTDPGLFAPVVPTERTLRQNTAQAPMGSDPPPNERSVGSDPLAVQQVPRVGSDPTLSYVRMVDIAQHYLAGVDPADLAVSPLFGEMSGLPPTIITTGSNDLLSAGCLRLARRMRRAGVDVDCRVWDRLWHVFEFDTDVPEALESLAEVAEFIRQS